MAFLEFVLRILAGLALLNELRRKPLLGCVMTIAVLAVIGVGLVVCGAIYSLVAPGTP
jgi:hypothetical protein